jgi:PucR family transcriptional regulator, purine catabolism regulatory protein
MRDLHARMLTALRGGEGLRGIAELAAEEAGGPVAIVLPARGLAAASSDEIRLDALLSGLSRGTDGRREAAGPAGPEAGIEDQAAIEADGEVIGWALALAAPRNGMPRVRVDREEILRTAALAALAEVAVADARDQVAADVRGSLLEDLRGRRADPDEIVVRAARLGCDLRQGAVALVTEVRSARPRHAAALIAGEHRGAIAEAMGDRRPRTGDDGARAVPDERVYALLPALAAGDAPERTQASARSIADRLRPHGPAAFSSFCAEAADLGRALSEAELMLDVIARDDRVAEQLASGIGDGVYRLLFRAMAADPDEVRRFYEDTVEPLVAHDRQYRTDLLGTLEAYLGNDCNMNATARTVFAHRHTVAHRLARVRELTGLDPAVGEDRERLGLGIKAYRILAPTLPR